MSHQQQPLFQREAIPIVEAILNTVGEAITVVDRHGVVTHWNHAAEDLYGIRAEEIVGRPISDFAWKSLMISRILEEGQPIRQAYHEPMPGIHVLVNSTVLTDSDDQLLGVISSEQDVTRLVRLGNELFTTSNQLRNLEEEMTKYAPSDNPFYRIKGHSTAIMRAIETARRVASTDATVLITGESGVGKELFARALHRASGRHNRRFVALNCGAIPNALFESELFGYQGGSFSGADKHGRQGKVEVANHGTLFLDEIGELPLDMQVKLLRAIQERQFYRIGGTEPLHVDVRIIAATNRNLEQMVVDGKFREDLYYRLNVVNLEVPSLRERIEDIPELIQLFSREMAQQYNRPLPRFAPEVMVTLMNYPWPGNIRQLRNLMERLIILTEGEWVLRHHLPSNIRVPRLDGPSRHTSESIFTPDGQIEEIHEQTTQNTSIHRQSLQNAGVRKHLNTSVAAQNGLDPDSTSRIGLKPPLANGALTRETLLFALQTTYGNKAAAARLLGVSRGTLYNKIRQYNLQDNSGGDIENG